MKHLERALLSLSLGFVLLLQGTPVKADIGFAEMCEGMPHNSTLDYGLFTLTRVDHDQTCNGGWPGSRTCYWAFPESRTVLADTVGYEIFGTGWVNSAGYDNVSQVMFLDVGVGEGDVFNPGKHTTSYDLWYCVMTMN